MITPPRGLPLGTLGRLQEVLEIRNQDGIARGTALARRSPEQVPLPQILLEFVDLALAGERHEREAAGIEVWVRCVEKLDRVPRCAVWIGDRYPNADGCRQPHVASDQREIACPAIEEVAGLGCVSDHLLHPAIVSAKVDHRCRSPATDRSAPTRTARRSSVCGARERVGSAT